MATSSSRSSSHRRRASPLGHAEVVAMVQIMDELDYDMERGQQQHPNDHKERILRKVIRVLHRKFGVERTVGQLQKKWSDLKLKERDRLESIRREIAERGETPRQREHSRARHRARKEGRPTQPLPPPEASVGSTPPSPPDVAPAAIPPVPEAILEEVVGGSPPPTPLPPAVQEEDMAVGPPASPAVPPLTGAINHPFQERREAVERRMEVVIDGMITIIRQLRHLHLELSGILDDHRSIEEESLRSAQTRGADGGSGSTP